MKIKLQCHHRLKLKLEKFFNWYSKFILNRLKKRNCLKKKAKGLTSSHVTVSINQNQNPFSPVSKRRERFKHLEVGERQSPPRPPSTPPHRLGRFVSLPRPQMHWKQEIWRQSQRRYLGAKKNWIFEVQDSSSKRRNCLDTGIKFISSQKCDEGLLRQDSARLVLGCKHVLLIRPISEMTSRPRLNELKDNLELVYTNGGEREGQMRMSLSHFIAYFYKFFDLFSSHVIVKFGCQKQTGPWRITQFFTTLQKSTSGKLRKVFVLWLNFVQYESKEGSFRIQLFLSKQKKSRLN